MRLLELELVNWRRHKKFRHTFKTGSTCILGANGTGKSSLLDAVKYLLTASWGDTCDKPGNIRIGSKGESFAQGVWLHNGVEFTVRRNLQGKSWLQIGSDASGRISSAAEIEDRLQRLLGVSADALLGMSFVDQNCIASFVTDTRAKWLDDVAQLCDVDSVERLHKLLSERLSADRGLAGTFVDQSDDCERSLAELRARLAETEQRLATTGAERLPAATQADYQAELVRHSSRTAAQETVRSCQRKLRKWDELYGPKVTLRSAKLQKLQERVVKLEALQSTIVEHYPTWQAAAQTTKEAVAARRDHLQAAKKIVELDALIARDTQRLADAQEEFTNGPDSCEEVETAASLLTHDVKRLVKELKLFSSGVCPTCNQPLKNFDLEDKKRQLEELQEKERNAIDRARHLRSRQDGQIVNIRRLENVLGVLQRERTELQQNLRRYQRAIQAELPPEQVERMQRKLAAAEASTDKLKKIRQQVAKLSSNLQFLNSKRAAWQASEATAQAVLDKYAELPHTVAELTEKLNKHVAAEAVYYELKIQRLQLQKDIKDTEAMLQANQDLKARCAAGGDWVGSLERWRQATHRDALQKVIVRGYLEERVINVNTRLREFSAPFSVALGENLLLVAKKANGIVHSIKQLSGGQRVILAVAYRLAVNTQDLLVLDEPTANLDKDNLHMFRDFLRDLSRTLAQEGKQLLMVTHEEALVSSVGGGHGVFDDVVRLK